MKERILITGGLGFVGIQLAYWLPGDMEILVTDIRPPSELEQEFLSSCGRVPAFKRLDVLDMNQLVELLETERVNHIVHGAAVTNGYGDDPARQAAAARLNVCGTLNVLEAAQKVGSVSALLFLSSSGVYIGQAPENGELQKEDGNFPLEMLYSVSKKSAEMVLEYFHGVSEMRIASARLGSVYGPFEMPTATRQGLSQMGQLARALHQGRVIKLYGGEITRDWVFGRDLAQSVYHLLQVPNWNYPVYNFGSGFSVSFQDIAGAFQDQGLAVEWAARAEEADVAMTAASWRAGLDMSRLFADTGYIPKTAVAEGIAELIRVETSILNK